MMNSAPDLDYNANQEDAESVKSEELEGEELQRIQLR
jgi:hypothetical protein